MSNLALSMRFVESCHWYTIAWNTNCLSSNNKKHRDSFYDLNGNIISSAHMISDTYINIIHWLDVQRRVGNWYMISSLSFILIISPEPHSILLLAPTYIPVSNMLDYSSVLNTSHMATIWNFDPNHSLPNVTQVSLPRKFQIVATWLLFSTEAYVSIPE